MNIKDKKEEEKKHGDDDALTKGMQSRDSCIQREQALGLCY